MRGTEPGHVSGLLPAYLNGTLNARDGRRVDDHLRACAGCRADLASWKAVQGAVEASQEATPAPSPAVLAGALVEIKQGEAGRSPLASRLSLAWQLLLGQLPLVRREIWSASATTMAVGWLVALLVTGPSMAGQAFALLAPVVAAVGVAFVYGPENDPSLEVALSTPTGPRNVLLARLVLVYGYDLLLALAATGAFVIVGGDFGLWPLISLWLGPMLFLSALALVVSLLVSPAGAVLVALSLWGLRLLATGPAPVGAEPAWTATVKALWQAEFLLICLAAALLAIALLCAPRVGRTPAGNTT